MWYDETSQLRRTYSVKLLKMGPSLNLQRALQQVVQHTYTRHHHLISLNKCLLPRVFLCVCVCECIKDIRAISNSSAHLEVKYRASGLAYIRFSFKLSGVAVYFVHIKNSSSRMKSGAAHIFLLAFFFVHEDIEGAKKNICFFPLILSCCILNS